jgi:hypothetical protein
MAINSKERFAMLPKGRQKAILARAEELIAEELPLAELREVRQRSQAVLAKKLGLQPAAISRLEQRTDLYLSTLRSLIEAMGGKLEIVAELPDRPPVRINQFRTLGEAS